jgi:hypothetical protein
LFGDLLRSWHTHPAGLVAALLCAQTADLAGDRFRLSARQSRRDCIGDEARLTAHAAGVSSNVGFPEWSC